MNTKLNYLLIPLLVVSLAGNVLFYFKIGELEKKIQEISQHKNQAFPVVENENQDQNDTNFTSWKKYTNSQLGFSIKFPQTVCGVNRCPSDEPIWVPIKIFEDNENGIVFITEEYYYDNWDRESQTNTGPCEKIVYSLESLQDEWKASILWGENEPFPLLNEKTFLGWGILIGDIKNEKELDKFVKDNYGPGCFVGEKELWKQEGVYEIFIKGEDWGPGTNLGNTTCPCNHRYKILYALEKNKVMSVNLGQECTFGTDPMVEISKPYECYDGEMIDSFRFE